MAYGRVLNLNEPERRIVIQLDDPPDGTPIRVVAYKQYFLGNHWDELLALPGLKRFSRTLEFTITYRENQAPLATDVVVLPD